MRSSSLLNTAHQGESFVTVQDFSYRHALYIASIDSANVHVISVANIKVNEISMHYE